MIKTSVNKTHNNIITYVNDGGDVDDAEIYDDIYSINNKETQESNNLKKNVIGESGVIMQHNNTNVIEHSNTNVVRHKNTNVDNLLHNTFNKMNEKKYFNILGKIKNYNDYKLYVISPKKFNNKMRILNETESNEISENVMIDISNKIEIENMNCVLKRINNINENNNKLNNNSEIYKLIIKLDEIPENKLNEIIDHYNNLMLSVKQNDKKKKGAHEKSKEHNNTNIMQHENTNIDNPLYDTFDKMNEKKYFNILGKIKNYNDYKLYVISPKKFNNKMRILNETENNEISENVMIDISNKIEIENMNYVLKKINNISENNNKLNNNSEIYKLIVKLDEISEDKLNEIINHYNNLMLSVKQNDKKWRGGRKKSKQRLNKLK